MSKAPHPMSYFHGRSMSDEANQAVDDAIANASSDSEDRSLPYGIESVHAEMAMVLYRRAVRLGLHATGSEAVLLKALDRAENEIAKLTGQPRVNRGVDAAEAIKAGAKPSGKRKARTKVTL